MWGRTGWRLLSLAAALVACAPVPAQLPADRAENARPGLAGRPGTVRPGATEAETLIAVQAAVRADAARTWGLADGASLAVVSQPVVWSDGALGCPQPGLAYTQALVPGWRLVVREGGRERVYHASQHGAWLMCPAGRATPALPGAAIR